MKKTIAFVAAVVLAGCGTESNSQSSTGEGVGHGGGFPITAISGALLQHAVLNSNRPVTQPLTTYDGATDSNIPVTCTVDATCTALNPLAVCNTAAPYAGQCTVTTNQDVRFYVASIGAATTSINVPCDGQSYTVEVYGSRGAANGLIVGGAVGATSVRSDPFVMPTTCVAPTVTWNPITVPVLPAPAPGTCMSGMPAPLNTFRLTVTGLGYPLTTWSATPSPVSLSGATATFSAPTAPATTSANVAPCFHLDASLLLGTSTAYWETCPAATAVACTPSGGVTGF